jgi:hypothetical protein
MLNLAYLCIFMERWSVTIAKFLGELIIVKMLEVLSVGNFLQIKLLNLFGEGFPNDH